MPYKNNDYKNFIRSSRWQRLRGYHLKRHPLCARCQAKGKVTLATEVHHVIKCHDDPALQMDPRNLESLCSRTMRRWLQTTAVASAMRPTAKAMQRTQSIQAIGHACTSSSQPTQPNTGRVGKYS